MGFTQLHWSLSLCSVFATVMSQYWNAHRFLSLWGTQGGAAEGTEASKPLSQGWPLFSTTRRVLRNSCQISYGMSSHQVYNFLPIKLELSIFWKNTLEVKRLSRAMTPEVHRIYMPWGGYWPSSLRHQGSAMSTSAFPFPKEAWSPVYTRRQEQQDSRSTHGMWEYLHILFHILP